MSVVPINKNVTPALTMGPKPDEKVIAYIRTLLEEAEAGYLVGIITATVTHDDLSTYGSVGRITRAALGCLEIIKAVHIKAELDNNE